MGLDTYFCLTNRPFQPELRYWFSKPGRGHFLGPHIHIARYNLKWKEYRYQDTGYPLWGVGFSYGYTVSLTALWEWSLIWVWVMQTVVIKLSLICRMVRCVLFVRYVIGVSPIWDCHSFINCRNHEEDYYKRKIPS